MKISNLQLFLPALRIFQYFHKTFKAGWHLEGQKSISERWGKKSTEDRPRNATQKLEIVKNKKGETVGVTSDSQMLH